MTAEYYLIETGYGPLHIHIDYDSSGPKQVFCSLPPLGTELSGLTSLVGILLSKYLAAGGDPTRMIKHLNSIKGDRPLGFGDNKIDSIAHAISVALKRHLEKMGKLAPVVVEHPVVVEDWGTTPIEKLDPIPLPPEKPPVEFFKEAGRKPHKAAQVEVPITNHCEKCYSSNVSREGGCIVCKDCGESKCG